MQHDKFYIDGAWVPALSSHVIPVLNPATERVLAEIPEADEPDVNRAVAAARTAFDQWSCAAVSERRAYLERINDGLKARNGELAAAISQEMGAPKNLSCNLQAPSGTQHFTEILEVLDRFEFSATTRRGTLVRHEPIGVCALISPWNWPMNQVATKLAPALAAGCTVILKPSEVSPLSALVLADIIHAAGLPPGVFNLVQGRGANMGRYLTAHPQVDMVSFTGSTCAGVAIAESAAPSVKRVALELGGKSAGIVAAPVALAPVVDDIISNAMLNSGQSCNALTRVLVSVQEYPALAAALARKVADLTVGDPCSDAFMGPVASQAQFDKVQAYIRRGLDAGATLLAGGEGRPEDLNTGYYVKPTLFGDVTPDMAIAREEIFGPVLCLMRYQTVDEAVRIANDSAYGLSGYVWCDNHWEAVAIADRLRTGMVHLNGAGLDSGAPFGGYKQSGNGREWGEYGLHEYLELKSIYGGAG